MKHCKHSAKIILDSVNYKGGRLITMEVVIPRIVLAELNTHRVFSRNSASSRAIPIRKMMYKVLFDRYTPTYWGANQKGMQARREVGAVRRLLARSVWAAAAIASVMFAAVLAAVGIHKQTTNRLLEPFLWHTVLITSTEWDNFFALRDHEDAHPDIRIAAQAMKAAIAGSIPVQRRRHLPYITEEEMWLHGGGQYAALKKVSAMRCARVSYERQSSKTDFQKDVEGAEKLLKAGHMSPFEHQAEASHCKECQLPSNFQGGWDQYRKQLGK